jgi:hypothetical protein
VNPHAGATDLTDKSEAEPIEEDAVSRPAEPAVRLPRNLLVAVDILCTDELVLKEVLLWLCLIVQSHLCGDY